MNGLIAKLLSAVTFIHVSAKYAAPAHSSNIFAAKPKQAIVDIISEQLVTAESDKGNQQK